MKKLSARKKLVKEADRVVSIYIRLRDGKSVTSGKTERLTNSHLFSRNSYSTRWDTTEDGNCHCQTCEENFTHEYDPYEYTRWYQKKFGIEKYDELHFRHKQTLKLKDYQIQEIIDETKAKIKDLEEKHKKLCKTLDKQK